MNRNIINSREFFSLSKNKTSLNDSNNNDDTISHENIISHVGTSALKEDLVSYQVKFIKELQNVKDAFLKKLSDIEQNIERNFKEKEYYEKYEKLLNLLEKENLFLKDEFKRKVKVINT